jgi:hypothetical protein
LKLSTKQFSIGLPGRMKSSWMSRSYAQASSARLVNSGRHCQVEAVTGKLPG